MIDIKNYSKQDTLKDGTTITIRAVHPQDKQMMRDAFFELDRQSRYTRFLGFKDQITDDELKKATEVDFEKVVALVITTIVTGKEIIIGGGRYFLLTAANDTMPAAEVAFTIEEDYQGQGLASRLFVHLAEIARSKGIAEFEAEVLPQNKAMLAVFKRQGLPMTTKHIDGLIHVSLAL